MTKLPSMPLYVDDFEAATSHLTPEEDGIYNRLLRLCWRSPECMVPDDEGWLMRRLRLDPDTFERVARSVIAEFFTCRDGRIFQKRQRQEFLHVTALVKKRKESGARGGRAKALKSKDIDVGKPSDLPEANDKQNDGKPLAPTPTSTSTLKEEEGARAREADFLISVRAALGMDPSDYPPYWTGPTAEAHVERWKGFGLSEADIIAEAKASRAKNPEPPDGPKGLDRWMERAAKAKAAATAPMPEGLTGKAAAAPPKAPSTPEERLAWYAGKINGAGYFAPNGASPQLCRALLDAGLVTPEKLRERGLVA